MSFHLTTTDIEYLLILLVLAVLFVIGLKPKDKSSASIGIGGGRLFQVDLNMSNAMKGIACVLILMGHWGTLTFPSDTPWGISRIISEISANMALFWFMFFSGYGLSCKTYQKNVCTSNLWFNRCKKVYLPLLATCVTTTIVYAVWPFREDSVFVPNHMVAIHNLNSDNVVSVLLPTIGWIDWYVLCILYFYSFFYISLWAEKRFHIKQTYLLFLLLLMYLLVAIPGYGYEKAHYYRYPWVFFFGHIIAKWDTYNTKKWPVICCIILSVTLILENGMKIPNIILNDVPYAIATIILLFVSIINRKYQMQGRAMLLLGSISYFFYLSHERITYFIITNLRLSDVIIWTLSSVIIAYLLNFSYKVMTGRKK